MTGAGGFTTHRRDGDDIIKTLHHPHRQHESVVAATRDIGQEDMHAYLARLRSAGVRLPAGMSVESVAPLTVRHRWVPGPVLLDYAASDVAGFLASVVEVAHWVRAVDVMDARVDTNLANVVITGEGAVLVDVLPPLIPSTRPHPVTLFDVLFTALCFDTAVILDALVGYAARALLHAGARLPEQDHQALARQRPHHPPEHAGMSFPASWFRARATLALRALTGRTDPADAQSFFAATSVRTFRGFSEPDRAERVRQIDQLLRERDLQ